MLQMQHQHTAKLFICWQEKVNKKTEIGLFMKKIQRIDFLFLMLCQHYYSFSKWLSEQFLLFWKTKKGIL